MKFREKQVDGFFIITDVSSRINGRIEQKLEQLNATMEDVQYSVTYDPVDSEPVHHVLVMYTRIRDKQGRTVLDLKQDFEIGAIYETTRGYAEAKGAIGTELLNCYGFKDLATHDTFVTDSEGHGYFEETPSVLRKLTTEEANEVL